MIIHLKLKTMNQEKWIKEKDKYKIPVNEKEIRMGKWSNVTRQQIVEVLEVSKSTELGVAVVEYYWKDCKIGRFHYIKPLTQFLRSYEIRR
jgi:hypothetical protein